MENKNKQKIKEYDGVHIVKNFVNYFYNNWIINPNQMLIDNVILSYSKLVYESNVYEGEKFSELLNIIRISGLEFLECNIEMLDSGSRQIFILVTGTIKNSSGSSKFTQSFTLSYAGEKKLQKWTLINSILKIIK